MWTLPCEALSFFFAWIDTYVLFWGHRYPCFRFLVMSPLGPKANVRSLRSVN